MTLGSPGKLSRADRRAVEAEVADIERFEGVPDEARRPLAG